MYKLQPLFSCAQETPLPNCIYRMPKISNNFSHDEANISNNLLSPQQTSPDVEVQELEKRWNEITSRLHRLQSDITTIKSTSSCLDTPVMPVFPKISVQEIGLQQDALIGRISILVSSLSELRSKLTLMHDQQNGAGLTVLQIQQKSLLDRIVELNDEIKLISSALGNNNNHHEKSKCCSNIENNKEVLLLGSDANFQDLVIRASPNRPPHSLPLVQRQLQKLGVVVYSTTHVHSTAASNGKLTEDLRNFLRSDPKLERSKARMCITLIWVEGGSDEPSLMVSPSTQSTAIQGEANIIRYLIRLVPSLLDYEKLPVQAARIDQLLDMTDTTSPLGSQGVKKERVNALQQLEKLLDIGHTREPNAVGFVLYSALVNAGVLEKEIGKNVKTLLDRCRSSMQPVASKTNDEPRAKLERYLTELGIPFTTLIHPAVFTVSELMEHVICMPGLHAKNLFVKDKKSGSFYLVTVRHDVPVQLNVVAKLVKAKELRFADPDVLLAVLGVPQGSVTPFALMNDADHVVTFVLDEQLWNDDSKIVNFHPLINTSTTGITVAGFKVFLNASGHNPVIIQL